ncbi:MAG: cation:proton antiporter [Ignavibacteriae bacterium]|nr:cation:proton antiporter [Ignavibacteriota bacterium]
MHSGLLYSIGLSIVAASLLAYLAHYLRQPLILGYILAGVLLGPQGFKLVENQEEVAILSELGLAFLLFIVGLEIDIKKFFRLGTSSAIIGTVQVVLCSILGYNAALWLGYEGLTAAYLGVALSFSSTMIVVKLLSDRKELDTLPGRVSLGILLVQDVLAIFVLAAQGNINDPQFGSIALSVLMGLGLVAVSFLVSKYLLPKAFSRVARNPELVLVLSISWCFVMCWLALEAEFSIAMGALIAGVSISTFPYSHDVIVKIRSLRDFFVTLFFVALGMQIIVTSVSLLIAGLVLSIFILASRFVTIFPMAYLTKMGSRVGVLSSLALGQSSEFSLVIVTLGLGYGHITRDIVSLVAITLVVTSTASTYLIMASHHIARFVLPWFELFGLKSSHHQEEQSDGGLQGSTVLLGCHRLGSTLVYNLVENNETIRVLDFNPEVLTKLKTRGIPASYVDISHLDALHEAGIGHASIVVCSVPDDYLRGTTNLKLLQYVKSLNGGVKVIVQAHSLAHALELYRAGADYVLVPSVVSSEHILGVIEKEKLGELDELRNNAVQLLQQRWEVL